MVRVDLDGLGEALLGSFHVSHIKDGEAHVDVEVGVVRRDADGFLVVIQGLVQLALIIQNDAQVAVCLGKLRVTLQ